MCRYLCNLHLDHQQFESFKKNPIKQKNIKLEVCYSKSNIYRKAKFKDFLTIQKIKGNDGDKEEFSALFIIKS